MMRLRRAGALADERDGHRVGAHGRGVLCSLRRGRC
jgi:hypothetical protein